MITLRRANERGNTKLSWLDSRHTFSFDRYYDPRYTGFRSLRVINEDRVAPGKGFGTHSHRDMEIITYVLEGAVVHRDSTGTNTIIVPGEVQRMSAGTGISHSEYNHSQTEPLHLLQIWILPDQKGLAPDYEQRAFDLQERRGNWQLVAAKDGRDGAVTVHQDLDLFVASLESGEKIMHELKPSRHAWMQVARGAILMNGVALEAGDGTAVTDEERLEFQATKPSEILLFDLA